MKIRSKLLGTPMITGNERANFSDLVHKSRMQGAILSRVILKVGEDKKEAKVAFCFNCQGKPQYYELDIRRNSNASSLSHVAIASRALGLCDVSPVELLSLSGGQYHITRKGLKRTSNRFD